MSSRGLLTISDGQDRIFVCCQKLDDLDAFFEKVADDDQSAFPAINDKLSEIKPWADQIHAQLERKAPSNSTTLDSDIQTQIESIEVIVHALEDKLGEAMAEMGPEYLKSILHAAEID